jgi:hypothetical protein
MPSPTCTRSPPAATPTRFAAVNTMKGRPPAQVGSITVLPRRALGGLGPRPAARRTGPATGCASLVDTFFALGVGFRGPAADHRAAAPHVSRGRGSTAQGHRAGYACPSNAFLTLARAACTTSCSTSPRPNRSAPDGAEDSRPLRADGLLAEFGAEDRFCLVTTGTKPPPGPAIPATCRCPPRSSALSTVVRRPGDPRPHLILERHGSMRWPTSAPCWPTGLRARHRSESGEPPPGPGLLAGGDGVAS